MQNNAAMLIAYNQELKDGGIPENARLPMVRDAALELLRTCGLTVTPDASSAEPQPA